MIFSNGIRNPVTAMGQRALTTVSSGAITSIGLIKARVQRQVGKNVFMPATTAENVVPKAELYNEPMHGWLPVKS